MIPVALSLGSNLGDRRAHLEWAARQLHAVLANLRTSEPLETEPVDVPNPQPPYLNMAAVGETSLTPNALMTRLLDIEKGAGRVRAASKAARTLDIDVIFYDDRIITGPVLVVPHPRFRHRRFVLEPLAAIAPDWMDPLTGKTVRQLFEDLEEKGA